MKLQTSTNNAGRKVFMLAGISKDDKRKDFIPDSWRGIVLILECMTF